ncbi:hypothetical protein Q5752_001900 [Cryptotrichosporon argae]
MGAMFTPVVLLCVFAAADGHERELQPSVPIAPPSAPVPTIAYPSGPSPRPRGPLSGTAASDSYDNPFRGPDDNGKGAFPKPGTGAGTSPSFAYPLTLPGMTMYDVESGSASGALGAPGRAVRRLVSRRARLALGLLAALGIFALYARPAPSWRVVEDAYEAGVQYDTGAAEAWAGGGDDDDFAEPAAARLRDAYVVDARGDHFYPHRTEPIAPAHPDMGRLAPARDVFADVDLKSHFRAPSSVPFPPERLRAVVGPREVERATEPRLPGDTWAERWDAPEGWDAPRQDLPKVQWAGFERGDQWETADERETRNERREAVRRAFAWAWQGYKDHAWGHDEIKPVTQVPSDPFNGWGASIVDTLDTILLMGFPDEYTLCRPHVNQLNFDWVRGRDWARNYVDEADPEGDVWVALRDRSVGLPVFETGIRYLGGLLGAYDLSGDRLLLERATDLADVLGRAFNTAAGLPVGRMDPGSDAPQLTLGQVSLAEVGSMTLELVRLGQLTGNRTWFDLAHRAVEFIDTHVAPRSLFPPLVPMWFMPSTLLALPATAAKGSLKSNGFTLGGLADSYYEYLVKAYQLLGATDVSRMYRRLYEGSIDAAKELLLREITTVPGRELVTFGKHEAGRYILETEHLSCFAGAMLGLGARLLDRPADLDDAQRFTQSCYWLSAATPTGLQPEVVEFFPTEDGAYENVTMDGKPYLAGLDPDHLTTADLMLVHKDNNGVLRWRKDGTKVDLASLKGDGPVAYRQRLRGSPPGSRKVSGRGLNRPETIESIFYMFRLTGDRKWQEKGWKMFVSWAAAARVPGGMSSVLDVTRADYEHGDNMESFMFAETLKYHFLLQSDPSVLSLDDYVLNTEAHPLLATDAIAPGSQGLWTAPAAQDLGARAQGTDVQKWMRLEVLDDLRARKGKKKSSGPAGGGGRGMGAPRLPKQEVKGDMVRQE